MEVQTDRQREGRKAMSEVLDLQHQGQAKVKPGLSSLRISID